MCIRDRIITDERLREREKGPDGNNHGMFQKRWADHNYHEEGGESIACLLYTSYAYVQIVIECCIDLKIILLQ